MNVKSPRADNEAAAYYLQRLDEIDDWKKAAYRKRTLLSLIRLATMILFLVAGFMAWQHQDPVWLAISVFALVGFGRALILDTDNHARIRRLEGLDQLVRQELSFLTEDKPIPNNEQPDPDTNADPDHPYAFDLDLFGKGSLFAMMNRCPSEPGRRLLASWLLAPAERDTILDRQAAAQELARDPNWLFELFVTGRTTPLRDKTIRHILQWLRRENVPFREPGWAVVRWVYPLLTLGTLACFAAGLINGNLFSLCCILYLIVSGYFSKRVIKDYYELSGIVQEVGVLSEGVKQIEQRSFTATLNRRLQDALLQPNPASKEIKGLDKLLHRFDLRLNPYVFVPLNAFLLWDLWQLHGLNTWRAANRERLERWTDTLAAIEALGSLAFIHFNHPAWCWPEIVPNPFEFSARGLGHPLIPEAKRVSNDFETSGMGRLELVTGSNMAGKSTWLRTVGVNMILAMTGAPVCARSCRLSRVEVISSMRIADNLEDSTSTFYAELKRLRTIIGKVKQHEPVFILLDEILRGTNSRDRLAGSRALIRQLIREDAVGMIATHDLELAHMEKEWPDNLVNYYFDVQFHGDELGFDYTLRKGICTTKNAELLMRQIGIEFA